jgi:hypothetical protein
MPTAIESPKLPDLPDCLSEAQKQRYPTIASIVRATTARLPHSADKFSEPAHVFDRHHLGPHSSNQ